MYVCLVAFVSTIVCPPKPTIGKYIANNNNNTI